MNAAYAHLGKSSAGYWDRRARNYHHATKETVAHNPLLLKLRAEITPQTTLLDVGAGTGRFALALAPQAKEIIAVEPNASMLAYLQQEALTKNISNITCISTTWQ